jgi:hypothetical protein
MTTYTFKQTSPAIWIITLLITIFIGITTLIIIAVNKVFQTNSVVPVIITLVPFIILAFTLPRYTSTALMEISLSEAGIKKSCLKSYLFQQKPNDMEIAWMDIKDYVFEPARQFDKFKITLQDGSKFKFFHNNDENKKDDFLKFITDFEEMIKLINSEKGLEKAIKKGKTIYETNLGLALAAFAVIIMIGTPILLLVFKPQKTPNYAGIAGVYVGAIFYIIQVVVHRIKPKK